MAFHDQQYYPTRMSHGEVNTMYVMIRNARALELNTGQIPFTGPIKIIQSGMDRYPTMHYVPSPHKLLLCSNNNQGIIQAVSVETGKKVWEMIGHVDGKLFNPHGMFFSRQSKILFVADGVNSRVLVLHPGDGSHLQTLQLDWKIGSIWSVRLHQDKLVVHHHDNNKHKESYFSINSYP